MTNNDYLDYLFEHIDKCMNYSDYLAEHVGGYKDNKLKMRLKKITKIKQQMKK